MTSLLLQFIFIHCLSFCRCVATGAVSFFMAEPLPCHDRQMPSPAPTRKVCVSLLFFPLCPRPNRTSWDSKEEMTATISASTGLFDFLKEKVGDRKTRTEAYCDLLDKSLAGFVSPFLRKQDFQLQQGQCHVTVSDLASEWHWHRATVRSFLETLESLGQLERKGCRKAWSSPCACMMAIM